MSRPIGPAPMTSTSRPSTGPIRSTACKTQASGSTRLASPRPSSSGSGSQRAPLTATYWARAPGAVVPSPPPFRHMLVQPDRHIEHASQ